MMRFFCAHVWREREGSIYSIMATRWLPDIEEFFESYCRVLNDGGNLENVEDDRADFFARRIEDYEQTVRVLAARLQETIPNELPLHNNISRLLDMSTGLRARLQNRVIERENRELGTLVEMNPAPVKILQSKNVIKNILILTTRNWGTGHYKLV